MRRRILAAAGAIVMSTGTVSAAEPWVGRWSLDPAGCNGYGNTASTSALIVTETALRWLASVCRVGKIYRIGQDAHIEAHCWGDGKSGTVPISLKPRGDKLTLIWANAAAGEMRRCK
jgi:hypothetical protein